MLGRGPDLAAVKMVVGSHFLGAPIFALESLVAMNLGGMVAASSGFEIYADRRSAPFRISVGLPRRLGTGRIVGKIWHSERAASLLQQDDHLGKATFEN